MTAFAFILGVVPLMIASGAGAGAQNVMGTGVFWGMLVATALGVFIIPGNFTFVEGLGRRRQAAKPAPAAHRPKERTEMTRRQIPPALVVGLIAAGCTVGPDYKRPEVVGPGGVSRRPTRMPPDAGAASFGDLAWWKVFQDPDLQELIRTALVENYDLRVAVSRILQAQSPGDGRAVVSVPDGGRRRQRPLQRGT